MRRLIGPATLACLTGVTLLSTSCSLFHKKPEPQPMSLVKRFHGQAMLRVAGGSRDRPVDLSGLRVEGGTLPGMTRYPHGDECSAVVFSANPEIHDAVQVILSPGLDLPEPEEGDEPVDQPAQVREAITAALQSGHRYVSSELGTLPGPVPP